MSELTMQSGANRNIRRQLLTTASAVVLISALCGSDAQAAGEDSDRPSIWVEIGGQVERLPRAEDRISPPFALSMPRPDFETIFPISLLNPPRYAVGGEGKITFMPHGTDWVFAASVRYGRSNGNKHLHKQTYTARAHNPNDHNQTLYTPGRFEDAKTDYGESHTILDFAVGKDVGLGVFGQSTASLGVRYAQFSSSSTVSLSAKPDNIAKPGVNLLNKYTHFRGFHNYLATASTSQNFQGVGPSLSFSGDTSIIGNSQSGLTFDWGVNGALLFGRQRARVKHITYGHYKHASFNAAKTQQIMSSYSHPHNRTASRSVTVPDVGGFAGVSFRYPNAKISLGYRADFFFGAMDGGLDTRTTYDRSFYGPFATISIGFP